MKLIFFVIYWSVYWFFNGVTCEQVEENNDDTLVELYYGKVRGTDNGDYLSFRGIPYAESPMGELRFENPQPYRQKWTDVYDATKASNDCIQWNYFIAADYKLSGVEDCLFLNVYKPKTGKKMYPVMVFIHGGGFMFGSPNNFGHDFIMKNRKMILVTITYRVGPMGFLCTQDESITGNSGLKDQREALKWIKKNIARFGGDPKKILVSGFSAGAVSVQYHMLDKEFKNIAKAAASLSGTALCSWALIKNPAKDAVKLAEHLSCPNTEDTHEIKRCLKSKTAEEIVEAVKYFLNYGYNPFTVFGPVIEHRNAKHPFLTQHPLDIIKSGNFTHIPWLASYTAQEAGLITAELLQYNPITGQQLIDVFNEKWLEYGPQNLFLKNTESDPQAYAKHLKCLYVGNQPFSQKNYLKLQKMFSDVVFIKGIHDAVKYQSLYSKSPVYSYVYDNPADKGLSPWVNEIKGINFGTIHTYDLTLIFSYPGRPLRPDEKIISKKFINMLADFAETGELTFGDCSFEKNDGKSNKIKVLHITRDDCKTIAVRTGRLPI